MSSRSVRRRDMRRRTPVVDRFPMPAMALVAIELQDVKGVMQSFLISPGESKAVTLSAYRVAFGGLEHIEVPVIVRANVV